MFFLLQKNIILVTSRQFLATILKVILHVHQHPFLHQILSFFYFLPFRIQLESLR